RTSSACAGSALTLGIEMNSRSSSSQALSTGARVYGKEAAPRRGEAADGLRLRGGVDPAAPTGHEVVTDERTGAVVPGGDVPVGVVVAVHVGGTDAACRGRSRTAGPHG